ncbi:MAG: hypothetical protein WAV98_03815 [Minisyncoccia bacterium]
MNLNPKLSNQLTGQQSLNQQIHVLDEIWARSLAIKLIPEQAPICTDVSLGIVLLVV